uniref:Ciliary microtubule inner protein 2C n=1 Tax=Cavia porcellus TaxID=10141 RepID=A0A286XS29_CAVPO
MASRSAGTLLTEFNAAYVPPSLMPGYQGHVPGVAFSFGSPYGTTTLKYFQDHRSAAMGQRHVGLSSGSSFPTIFSANPDLVLTDRSQFRDRWLHMPSYTRFNLDSHRSAELASFYQQVQHQPLSSVSWWSCRRLSSIGITTETRPAWCPGSPTSCCL